MNRDSFLEHSAHEQKHWWFLARRKIMLDLLNDLFVSESGLRPKVVEVGCGTGANVAAFAEHYDCLGAEISMHAVKIAREQFPHCNFLHYSQTDELKEPIGNTNAVLLLDVLEHVRDEFQLFSELVTLAKPGSYFVITVPADPKLWCRHDEAMFHFRRYTPERLGMVWTDLPLKLCLFTGLNWKLAPVIRTVRSLQHFRPTPVHAPKCDLSLPPSWANALLYKTFASESKTLRKALVERSINPRNLHGVSLVAILQKTEAADNLRKRPQNCPPDQYNVPSYELDG